MKPGKTSPRCSGETDGDEYGWIDDLAYGEVVKVEWPFDTSDCDRIRMVRPRKKDCSFHASGDSRILDVTAPDHGAWISRFFQPIDRERNLWKYMG